MSIFGWTADFYTFAWLAWFALFFAIEIPATQKPGATLSEHFWHFMGFGIEGWPGWRIKLHRLMVLLLGAWLIVHIFFGGNFL